MDFKKFSIKVSIIIFPIYLIWIIYIETFPLYYNTSNNTRTYFISNSLKNAKDLPKAKILFFGDSRVNAGIDFLKIKNSYSFATGGATTIEMYYILKKYLQNKKKPETLFISISPRFLTETYGFYQNSVRNNLINYTDFSEIISNRKKNKTDTILGEFPYLKFFLCKARYIEFYQKDILINNVFGGYKKNSELISIMKKMAGACPHPGLKDSCSELNFETGYKKFEPSPLLDLYLNKIFETCKEKNIHLIFEFMPVNKSSFYKFNPKFITDYKKYMFSYKQKYPEFGISDSVYWFDNKYFGDKSHLNEKGKEKITAYFKNKFKI
jgi:hypothetical protein